MNTEEKILLLVDQQSRDTGARLCHQRINTMMEASHFKQLVYAICDNVWPIAVVSQDDQDAFQMYRKAGYDVIGVNGNRSQKIKEIMDEIRRWVLSSPLTQIVFITTDDDLLHLTKQLPQSRTKLHVWAPAQLLPDDYKHAPYNFRDLDKLIRPNSRVKIYLDYENLHIALEQMGIHPDPKKILEVIQNSLADLGDTISINAYADWGGLEKHSQFEIQRALALLGVETFYLISHYKKNSADMRIARDLYLLMEKDSTDVIVVVSGDRDFRDVVKALRESGKRIVFLGLQSTMSSEIAAIANHVRYLDEAFRTPVRSGGQRDRGVHFNDQNLIVMRAVKLFDQRNYAATDKTVLVGNLGIVIVEDLLQANILIPASSGRKETMTLNYKMLQVEQIIYLIQWVVDHIESALKKMPWVDSNYLSKGMQMDTRLRNWQLGQTRPNAEYWLSLLEAAGTVVRIKQAHPNNPERIINTWWTPEKALALKDSARALLPRPSEHSVSHTST